MIPGRRSVLELLRHRPERIKQVFISEGAKFDPELYELCSTASLETKVLTRQAFRDLSASFDMESTQGVIAEITKSSSLGYEQFLDKVLSSTFPLIVALDQIQDPQNLGAIFRVCECVGIGGVIFPRSGSVGVTPTVRKTSIGASEILLYSEVSNLSRAINEARDRGFLIYGTSLSQKSDSIYTTTFSLPMMLVLGSEHSGLRQQTEKLCDSLIYLPMHGVMQSLNVSTAASALLFELRRVLK